MNANTKGAAAIGHVLVCGSGLAARMTVAALSAQLPGTRITLVSGGNAPDSDIFYGNVTGPGSYAFNLSAGLSEPKLVTESDVAFSWGTKYVHWAPGGRSWVQCFQLPFPVIDGVQFQHYLAQQGVTQIEGLLVSAAAARKGAFMHPPQQGGKASQQPLGRCEYGYQFDPASYARLFHSAANSAQVEEVSGELGDVECDADGIARVRLADGRTIEADLYIDCTGPEALLLSRLVPEFVGSRRLRAAATRRQATKLGAPVREVRRGSYGWQSLTPVRDGTMKLTVYDPQSEEEALAAHGEAPDRSAELTIGRRNAAWSGNCVAIGHAARVMEPLTPAPIMLLENDIERLMTLIPFSRDMSVESREFNRRFTDDHEHAELFTRAFLETDGLPETPYWQAARAEPPSEKLARKIELFADRGVLVAYDLEPFHAEDWMILHYGMGRHPGRYDPAADRAQKAKVQAYLANLKREVDKTVEGMPSHAAYMAELSSYLARNRR